MAIDKVTGTAWSSLSSISGVAKAGIAKVAGQDAPSGAAFTNTKSLFTDGVNDYFQIGLSSEIIDSYSGSVSLWVKIASDETGTSRYFSLYDATDYTNNRIEILFFNTSGAPQARSVLANYRIGSSSIVSDAKTASAYHGKPFSRIASDYGDFNSAGDHVYQAGLSQNNWNHIVLTWNTSENFTYGGTTYSGSMRLYFNGTLVNHGQSTFPAHNGNGVSSGISGSSSTVFDNLRIGAYPSGTSALDANIDEVAMFDSPLSASDVTSIYNSGAPGDLSSYTNLVGWWRFEDNTNDSSGNSNSGALTNGATYSSVIPS